MPTNDVQTACTNTTKYRQYIISTAWEAYELLCQFSCFFFVFIHVILIIKIRIVTRCHNIIFYVNS